MQSTKKKTEINYETPLRATMVFENTWGYTLHRLVNLVRVIVEEEGIKEVGTYKKTLVVYYKAKGGKRVHGMRFKMLTIGKGWQEIEGAEKDACLNDTFNDAKYLEAAKTVKDVIFNTEKMY